MEPVRIGVFSDIHNRYNAIDILIEIAKGYSISRLIGLGDSVILQRVSFPSSIERTIAALRDNGIDSVLGNHDEEVLKAAPKGISKELLDHLAEMPEQLALEELAHALFIHSFPLYDNGFHRRTPEKEFEYAEEHFPGRRLIFSGHWHASSFYWHDGEVHQEKPLPLDIPKDIEPVPTIINPGSVYRVGAKWEMPRFAIYQYDGKAENITFVRVK